MALPGILPFASTINGTSDVFGVFVWWFTIAANHSSSCTDELLPVRGIVFTFGDSTASYGDAIWESEYFPSASSSFEKKLPVPSKKKKLLPILVIESYRFDIWESKFFPSAFSSCKEELVVTVGSRIAWHRENIWEASMALPRILSSAPITHRNGISDFKMVLTWFWESRCMAPENSLCTEELFLVRLGTASRLVGRENIHVTMLNTLWFFFCILALGLCILDVLYTNLRKDRCERPHCSFEFLMVASMEAEDHHRKSLKPFLRPASPRFPANNDLCAKLSWAVRLKILREIASGAIYQYLHKMYQRGGYDTSVPKLRAAGTHNKFTVAALATRSTGSPVMHAPKYLSVHHPLVQMMLLARDKFAETFACIKSMVPKSIFDMAKRLCPFALPNGCKADWNSARSMSESPEVGTLSDLNTENTIGKRNELTENESHLSDPDLSGAEHGIKEVKAKTSAPWVAATAAPHHATGNGDILSGFVIEHDAQFVHAADGVPRKVLARGAVITDAVVLPDVWFVPGLTENLVSVSQLAELDHSIGFGRGECSIRNARDGKIVGKGHLQKGGHYVLDFVKVPLAI